MITAFSLLEYDGTSFAHQTFLDFLPFFFVDPRKLRQDGDRRWTAIFRSLQRFLILFKSELWLGHSRTFTELSQSKPCLGCVLRVIALLEGEHLAESEVLSTLDQVFIKDNSVLYFVQLNNPPP